ncbi:MAG: IS1182 family transposase [Clostridiaceae bacterium]|nr:IS1182 family transposase [Clostridiaceae bacterium]
MMGKNSGQIDVFNSMIYEKLIPKDHLLVKIDTIIDFSFAYDMLKDCYKDLGRKSKDPAMMLKICLLEYLYNLSYIEVVSRIKTDVAFRWFLGLNIDDNTPDDTTISHFRIKRLGEKRFHNFFNEIVRKCIERDLVKTKRFIIDSTDVAANVNYPSSKKLLCNAFRKLTKEIRKFNADLAENQLEAFETAIEEEHAKNEKVNVNRYSEIANKHLEYLYLKTYDELQTNEKYRESFGLLHDLIDQYTNNKKDKIVSTVDPDARVAHKSPGNVKRGYKNHIIVDEESEIILSSVQTPFNVGDEKKLVELVDQVEENFEIKPEELSADKVYGTIDNRSNLKDRNIVANIQFYNENSREIKIFGIKEFNISKDLERVTCPNGITTEKYTILKDKKRNQPMKSFKFDKKICLACTLIDQCLRKTKNGKSYIVRKVDISTRYDAILDGLDRAKTEEFRQAYNKRYKVERRFATMVRKHGLRRCRYLKLVGAKIHITLANIACNIIRMVNLLDPSHLAMP